MESESAMEWATYGVGYGVGYRVGYGGGYVGSGTRHVHTDS